jgi:hypothetical protein
MTTTPAKPGRCCGGHEYATNGGESSDYCGKGQTFLCAECATNAKQSRICATHRTRVVTKP